MKKPKPLVCGDKVAIISLSSGMLGENSAKYELNIVRQTETEEEIMGMSPHFMVVSRK